MGHLTKWSFFSLPFSAIPYALVVALNQLQSPGSPLLHPSSEVLFIGVVATSSALGELWDDDEERRGYPRRRGRSIVQLMLLTGVLASSLLYGAYVYHSLMSPGRSYGIDCSAVVAITSALEGAATEETMALLREWLPTCGRWARVQAGFFRWSLWVTGLWVFVSVLAMHFYRPQKGWQNGMV